MNQAASTPPVSEPSLSRRRWDYICLAILIGPLVVLAFQGDLVLGLAERANWHAQFTVIHAKEAALQTLTDRRQALEAHTRSAAEAAVNNPQIAKLKQDETALQLKIAELRDPFRRAADYWNFSFVALWPLSLLLVPLLGALLWYSVPSPERRQMYEQALSRDPREPGHVLEYVGRTFSRDEAPERSVPARPRAVARQRGLLIGLAAIALFWLAGWMNGSLAQTLFDHRGSGAFQPPQWMTWGSCLALTSYALWTLAFVYAFTGWRGLGRLWVPLTAILALLILNFGPDSARWTSRWDLDPQWGYGYFVGPIAAYLFYCLMTEKAGRFGQGVASAGSDLSIDLPPASGRAGRTLLAWGLIGLLGAALGWAALAAVARYRSLPGPLADIYPLIPLFAPLALCGAAALLGLGLWQRWTGDRRGEDALRLAGLVVVAAAVAWRFQALGSRIAFLGEIAFVAVVFGVVLAWFGSRLMRVAWVPILFLLLAIPWPDREYRQIAAAPQEWAAMIVTQVMHLIGYHDMMRQGTLLVVGPLPTDVMRVAEECSGLRILFSFVAVSVVYAYIAPRPAWRRAVIVLSAFPIAIFSNFTRVFIMSLFYRWGYKGIAEGMTHQMVGYLMLIEAGLLLYLEMRALDFFEWLAEYLAGDGGRLAPPAERAP